MCYHVEASGGFSPWRLIHKMEAAFMRFYSLTNDVCDSSLLAPDYKSAREIGKIRLGESGLYVKSGLRTCYIPYYRVPDPCLDPAAAP